MQPRTESSRTPAIDCAGATDRGLVRESNQDHYFIAALEKSVVVRDTSLPTDAGGRLFGGCTGTLLVVADGMGGHRGGEKASEVAVQGCVDYVLGALSWCFRLDESVEHDFLEDLKASLKSCQDRIEERADEDPRLAGMGTTLTMGYVIGRRLYVVHAGDSRCYVLRNDRLEQVTTDHTMAQRLVDRGALGVDEVEASPLSHELWNALGGGSDDLQADVHRVQLEPDDRILLCTDGLTRHVADGELARTLGRAGSAADACRDLVEAARSGGGSDNITAVVAVLGPEAS